MKYFFTLFFSSLFYLATAQNYPWLTTFFNEIPNKADLWDSSVAANKYHSMTRTLTQFNKKGIPKKRKDIFSFTYDEKGFITSFSETSSNSKKSRKYDYLWKDSVIMRYVYFKNNELQKQYEISRNSNKKITDLVKKDSKGRILQKQHNEFDPGTNMLKRASMLDKNNKEKKVIEYSYYDVKNMKQAKEYKNGKLKRVWNYTCDPAGSDEKKVKEIKVCKNVNVDENGNRVESSRTVNHKGEVELRVSTFDKNNKMIRQLVYDDIKHKLRSGFETTIVNGNEEVVYKYYDKKERPVWISKATYNGSHKILSSEFSTGKKLKLVYKNTYQYNAKNLLIQSESFDSKGRKNTENIHAYN